MTSILKLLTLIIELLVQLKRKDDNAKRKERAEKAKSDPVGYLRQFGRVQYVDAKSSGEAMPDTRASPDRDKSN